MGDKKCSTVYSMCPKWIYSSRAQSSYAADILDQYVPHKTDLTVLYGELTLCPVRVQGRMWPTAGMMR